MISFDFLVSSIHVYNTNKLLVYLISSSTIQYSQMYTPYNAINRTATMNPVDFLNDQCIIVFKMISFDSCFVRVR